jgi:hypothetical protein
VFDAGERIGLMAADGSGLTPAPGRHRERRGPRLLRRRPAHRLHGANDRGTTDLYVRSVEGGAAQLIVNDAGEPTWSSRGVIAYVRSGNIYVARPGGRRILLVRPLATLTFDAPIGRMYEVGAHGEGLRRIGPAADASDPKWSPQGNWIAYEALETGVLAKKLGSSAPAREVALTQPGGEGGSVASFEPAWRPLPR